MAQLANDGFSVVIPVYNGTKTIERAIASVQAQDYANYEIIAVDDGSTDNSWSLLQRLAKKEPRLRLAQISNSGQPARPRNHAIGIAKGAYIAFLDQDDSWRPHKLSAQLKKFKDGDFAVVYSDTQVHDSRTTDNDFLYSSHMRIMPEGDVISPLAQENFVPMLSAVVQHKWLKKVGPISEKLPGVDDYELWLRIALEGGHFGYISEPLADYHLSETNLSHQQEMMMTSLYHCYQGVEKRYPAFAEILRHRRREAQYHLCGFFIGKLKHQKASVSARIGTAREAFAVSTNLGQWLRIVLWLILPRS